MSDSNEVITDILGYFLRNPQAADNLAGIVRWRLLDHFIARTTSETHEALVALVSKGYLSEVQGSGSPSIYRLAPDKADEARQLLAALEAAKK